MQAKVELSDRSTSIKFDDWMDERDAAEVLWFGHFIHAKDFLVCAIEDWMKSVKSNEILSKDQLIPVYAKVGIITFAVQAVEDLACKGYAYLKALNNGVERIYEYIRDFGKDRSKGTVGQFFKIIASDDKALYELTGFQPNSSDFISTRNHLQSVYEFYKKYRLLYLKFKHGQAFVPLIWQNKPAVYVIPNDIEREPGKVKLPKEPYLILLDEWEQAKDITVRINGYFLQIRGRSRKFFPGKN